MLEVSKLKSWKFQIFNHTCSLASREGIALFTCMPTTLSSGVALTQLAGGYFALALAMTVISNMLRILAIPFSISKFVSGGVGIAVPAKELLTSLVLMWLIPLKILRESFKGAMDASEQIKVTTFDGQALSVSFSHMNENILASRFISLQCSWYTNTSRLFWW